MSWDVFPELYLEIECDHRLKNLTVRTYVSACYIFSVVVMYLRSSEEKACWPPRSLYVPAALLGLGVALFSSVVLPLSPGHFLFFLSYDHKWYNGEIEL